MILAFLRLFTAFRDLEFQVRELRSDKIKADDRYRALEKRFDASEAERAEMVKETLDASKKVADFMAEATLNRRIYGVGAVNHNEEEVPSVIKANRVPVREVQRWANSPERMEQLLKEVSEMEQEMGVTPDATN